MTKEVDIKYKNFEKTTMNLGIITLGFSSFCGDNKSIKKIVVNKIEYVILKINKN